MAENDREPSQYDVYRQIQREQKEEAAARREAVKNQGLKGPFATRADEKKAREKIARGGK